MAPSNFKLVTYFIDDIPDEKIDAANGIKSGTVYKDENFHFDNQGLTTKKGEDDVQNYNLQVQVNYVCRKTSLEVLSRQSVAIAIVGVGTNVKPATVKQMLKDSLASGPLGKREWEVATDFTDKFKRGS